CKYCHIDGIVAFFCRGKGGSGYYLVFRRSRERFYLGDTDGVLCYRPGLIGTEDIHPGHLLNGTETADDRLFFCEGHSTYGKGNGEDCRQGCRYRGDEEHEGELECFEDGVPPDRGDDENNTYERDGKGNQVIPDPDNCLLEVAPGRFLLEKAGGPAKKCPHSRPCYDRIHLSLPDNGSGIRIVTTLFLNRQRFPRKSRFIEKKVLPLREPDICRDDVTKPDVDDITGDQPAGRDLTPHPVPEYAGIGGETLFQEFDRIFRLTFLEKPDKPEERVLLLLRNIIEPVLLQPCLDLSLAEAPRPCFQDPFQFFTGQGRTCGCRVVIVDFAILLALSRVHHYLSVFIYASFPYLHKLIFSCPAL